MGSAEVQMFTPARLVHSTESRAQHVPTPDA